MRKILVTIIIICSTTSASVSGQNNNNLFVDLNYAHGPGLSLIYNYKIIDSIGIGLGGQVLYDNKYSVAKTALFADVKYQCIIGEHSVLFIHGDIGVDMHKNYTTDYGSTPPATLYLGLGLGYSYITDEEAGNGPYIALRFWGDGYMGSQVDDPVQQPYRFYNIDVTLVIAIGYRFW